MEYIRIKCHTNLDAFDRTQWPDKACCRPLIGERINSLSKHGSLKIVAITHCVDTIGPFLRIELHN